jgi:hypothetical protein
MQSPIEQMKAANDEMVARIAGMEVAAAQCATDLAGAKARICALEGDIAKHIEELSGAMQARETALAELGKVKAELAQANDTISGKMFRHVAGVNRDEAAAVAGGGEAGEEQKPFATKADALKAYDAIKSDPKAAQDFRRQYWAVLGLSNPA